MSQGQSQAAGRVEETIELAGRKLTLATPPVVEVFSGLREHWKKHRPDTIEWAARACEKAPPAQHETIWAAAAKSGTREPNEADLTGFINSIEGISYVLWACLRKHHGKDYPTPEAVVPLIADAAESKLTEIMQKTQVVTGEAEAKNSSGPSQND